MAVVTAFAPGDLDIVYTALGQLPTTTTATAVVFCDLVLLGAFVYALVSLARERRRGRAATMSVTLDVPPGLGQVVLRGVVETEEPSRPAITLTVREEGTEHQSKSAWTHEWNEIDRDLVVEPFYLLLVAGTRVRIEPDPTVLVADKLELTERGNPRERQARLENGEVAHVAGVLSEDVDPSADGRDAGLYRGGVTKGLVMRRGKDRMLVSTEPLGRRYERKARAHGWMALVLGAALVLVGYVIHGQTLAVMVFGENVDAAVVETRTWETRGKRSSTSHFGVRAKFVDPARGVDVFVEDEMSREAWGWIRAGRIDRVPFRVVRWRPELCNIGPGATIGLAGAVAPTLGVLALLVIYVFVMLGARDWYERKKTHESGSGRLVREAREAR